MCKECKEMFDLLPQTPSFHQISAAVQIIFYQSFFLVSIVFWRCINPTAECTEQQF